MKKQPQQLNWGDSEIYHYKAMLTQQENRVWLLLLKNWGGVPLGKGLNLSNVLEDALEPWWFISNMFVMHGLLLLKKKHSILFCMWSSYMRWYEVVHSITPTANTLAGCASCRCLMGSGFPRLSNRMRCSKFCVNYHSPHLMIFTICLNAML